jgi:hypothetical protein
MSDDAATPELPAAGNLLLRVCIARAFLIVAYLPLHLHFMSDDAATPEMPAAGNLLLRVCIARAFLIVACLYCSRFLMLS